jgi:hypothetical protein
MARAQTGNFAHLVAPGLRKVYFDTLKGIPKEFRQVFNILPPRPSQRSGLHYFDDLQVASLGTFGLKPEGQPIQYDVPIEGSTVRYQPYTFGMGFRITMEMQDDDLYDVMSKMSSQLAMAAEHQMEVQAFRLLNNGFATTGGSTGHTAAGFDTLALFSASHTLIRGGTRANRAATDLDLSVTAIEQAEDIFETWVSHSNFPMPKHGNLLIVPPSLKWIAKEITESELKPYTGNNEINPLGGEGLRYMVCHYLTDPDAWYLAAPKAETDTNVWMRMEPKFQMGDDFDTGDAKAKGVFRIASGHGEPDGWFGSQGA